VLKSLLAILLMTSLSAAAPGDESPNCVQCGKQTYGTSVKWSGSPSEAAAKAKADEKLVFVLHVSGHFEDPKFT
jgi:hypothetical protein